MRWSSSGAERMRKMRIDEPPPLYQTKPAAVDYELEKREKGND